MTKQTEGGTLFVYEARVWVVVRGSIVLEISFIELRG